ncbi:MAG: DUF4192 domain-containing protein [Actinomycetota bacterium]|nr:DUF4192 domain-containing protein [Actinomycetota bacterium]
MTIDRLAGPAPDIPLLRISGPADLLQAVPYLLGFHPQSSLVIIGLDQSRLVVTARLDLADLGMPAVLGDAIGAMRRGGASALVAAIYDDDARRRVRPLPWDAAVAGFVAEAALVGCSVIDVLLVAGQRWWSYACADTDCCPTDGRELTADVSAFSAAATYAGMVALPDRDALAAVLDPLADAERDRLWPLIADHENLSVQAVLDGSAVRHDRSIKRALFTAARRSDAPADPPERFELSDSDVARFGAALSAPALRDSVWMAADDRRLDGRVLWLDLARRLPSPYDAAPLFLYGWCSWRAGNGALAGIAAERAVASDPTYSAADLLLAALARGLDPRRLPKLRLPRSA